MRDVQRFKVFNIWGEVVAKGTAEECAKELGISVGTFRNNFKNQGKFVNSKYEIVLTHEPGEKYQNSNTAALIKMWDDFATPIREEFGIPVYKPKEGKR